MNPRRYFTIDGVTADAKQAVIEADGCVDVPAIEIDQLAFAWPGGGRNLLQIDRLVLQRGERVFLSGPSGSGKSTLLGLVGGVLKPQSGIVRVLGTSFSSLSARHVDRFRGDHIGFVFQSFNLLPYLSITANVMLPLQFSPVRRRRLAGVRAEEEASRLVLALGLAEPDVQQRPVHQLSIGQQQRVAAARALIGRPEILIADEPTSSLDADTRGDFLRLLMTECAQFGTSVLFVSHDRALSGLFDRSVALHELNRAGHAA
jgi:putative ABC transport system ATP-binding protein